MNSIFKGMRAFLILIVFACVSTSTEAASFKDSTKKVAPTVESFTVSDMGCATDSKMVETALYRKRGVKKVVINGDTVTVTYDVTQIKREEIIKTIENTGTCEDPNAKVHKVKFKAS